MFNEPLLTSPSTPRPLNLHNKFFAMDHTDADNVKPTEECHEVHNVDESDRLVGQLFCSRDQTWYFYKGFAWEHGFSARKGTTRLDVKGNVKTLEFCCSKEGFRASKANTWIISKSYQELNHALCTPTMTPFMRSNRAVSKADIDKETTSKEVGVGTSQVMNYLTQQAGAIIMLDLHIKTSTMHFKENFLEAMMNKSPILVVTDGDRQCRGLSNLLSLMLSTDYVLGIFLAMHKLTLVTQNLQQHSQNAWLHGGQPRNLIFNGVRLFHNSMSKSIHGCESMNASLAIALKHKKTYLNVVRAIEDGISRIRMNKLKADYLSSHTKPFKITKLFDLESHAATIFTRESFRAFQDELLRETLYRIEAEIQSLSDECQHYILSKYKEKNRKFEISFDSRTKTLICSCKKFETVGLPCRRQLHILKHLDYTYFPGTLIQSRWTNYAKASAPSYVDLNVSPEVMQMERFAALCSTSSRLCYIASKTDESFKTARDEMKRLIEELENSFGLNDSVKQSIVVNNVRDPQRKQCKRKEVPKNKVEKIIRQCGYCNGEGHNKLTCPQVKLSLSIM
ncbi:hypothetical protein F3Y22_tig00005678pilonHSYRG00007 [Hibiscus syriacus]|uniref:Protein FAR1-RELATED SEQUENCE n=1 Tax=Hibiscus syriacus TaxID=106335 RepID=A0A6A3CJC5_HIBSY|nr:hypothetical protein F3Y22_tig00005678pilonHSYRG00007 [Hibiscus syriacus]